MTMLLLPIDGRRGVIGAVAAFVGVTLVLSMASEARSWRGGSNWLLARVSAGDASMRDRDESAAVRRLAATPGVSGARRVPAAAVRAELAGMTGDHLPSDLPLPVLVEARLAPGTDTRLVRAALRSSAVVLPTATEGTPSLAPATRFAVIFTIGATTALITTTVAAGVRGRREGLSVLRRLGASSARLLAEAAVPATGWSVAGLAVGLIVASRFTAPDRAAFLGFGALLAVAILTGLATATFELRRLR